MHRKCPSNNFIFSANNRGFNLAALIHERPLHWHVMICAGVWWPLKLNRAYIGFAARKQKPIVRRWKSGPKLNNNKWVICTLVASASKHQTPERMHEARISLSGRGVGCVTESIETRRAINNGREWKDTNRCALLQRRAREDDLVRLREAKSKVTANACKQVQRLVQRRRRRERNYIAGGERAAAVIDGNRRTGRCFLRFSRRKTHTTKPDRFSITLGAVANPMKSALPHGKAPGHPCSELKVSAICIRSRAGGRLQLHPPRPNLKLESLRIGKLLFYEISQLLNTCFGSAWHLLDVFWTMHQGKYN